VSYRILKVVRYDACVEFIAIIQFLHSVFSGMPQGYTHPTVCMIKNRHFVVFWGMELHPEYFPSRS
jgi:hypothetical protein